MKEGPILFNAPMVRAILDGSKTQTRRVVKPQPEWVNENAGCGIATGGGIMPSPRNDWLHWRGSRLLRPEPRCPYGLPGDRLWVRETWSADAWFDGHAPNDIPDSAYIAYTSGRHAVAWPAAMGKVRRSIHMPRWASRILLEIADVWVERLHDISEADAKAEGAHNHKYNGLDLAYARAYSDLWESINGAGSWAANPWVWVVEFRRIEP